MKELVKITVNIYSEDKETLLKFFPKAGYQKALREMVHKHCQQLLEIENHARHNVR